MTTTQSIYEVTLSSYSYSGVNIHSGGPNAPTLNSSGIELLSLIDVSSDAGDYIISEPADPIATILLDYVEANNRSAESKAFASWAVEYSFANQDVTLSVFRNRFFPTPVFQDGDFNEDYWNDPNLVVPKQNLPTWENYSTHFPTHDRPNSVFANYAELLTSLGGDVGALYTPGGPGINTCAIRVSYALVRSGVVIPDIPATTINGKIHPAQTLKDKDGKYYFLRAKELDAWMRKTFGTNDGDPSTPTNTNHSKILKSQVGEKGKNLPGLLSGKKGIYCLVSDNMNWASGHADLLYPDATCGTQCHFEGPVAWIDVRILN